MRVEIKRRSPEFEASISDRLIFADHNAFRKLIDDIKATAASQCIFDLKDLSMMDSSGLGMFMIAIEEAKRNGFSLTLKNASGSVLQLIQMSRLDRFLTLI